MTLKLKQEKVASALDFIKSAAQMTPIQSSAPMPAHEVTRQRASWGAAADATSQHAFGPSAKALKRTATGNVMEL